MNDGDWICSDANCGNINFARRISCYRCNKEKPDGGKSFKKKLGTEIGKSAAEKSRGLFNADDWQCNKCANVNWARRHTCNVCNAPKFGEVEARTGYGGGYNERDVVEYRRRDSSSDEEYDEFGRKKRKRKSDPQRSSDQDKDKVGTTEEPVFKKLPPTMQLKGPIMKHVPEPPTENNDKEKFSGSLSDGSVCELPPLSNIAFRRRQIQSQTNYFRQDHMLPRPNRFQNRKRHSSVSDKDQAGSSGHESASKRGKLDGTETSGRKPQNPVMENRVSSTNNDVVYNFTGPTPAENFQVTYSVEERVKAAAFAIVYNNCKISTSKFEAFYDKPAPDFKTIFGWRQRLLTTGCLVDSHIEQKQETPIKSSQPNDQVCKTDDQHTTEKVIQKLPNPDEILIALSGSESDSDNSTVNNKSQTSRGRSASAETLLICKDTEVQALGISTGTVDEKSSASGSHKSSCRNRSSSRDSEDSNYAGSQRLRTKVPSSKNTIKEHISNKQLGHISDSESVSYDSNEDDFLSRVYKEKKLKHKKKKQSSPANASENYEPVLVQPFQGYTTAKVIEKSPLVTGNIYTPNPHNMAVNSKKENTAADAEGYVSEYVPTKLGPTAKQNYQAFKDNVKKRGYWAKANGQSISNKCNIMSNEPKITVAKPTVNKSYMANDQINSAAKTIVNKSYLSNNPTNAIALSPVIKSCMSNDPMIFAKNNKPYLTKNPTNTVAVSPVNKSCGSKDPKIAVPKSPVRKSYWANNNGHFRENKPKPNDIPKKSSEDTSVCDPFINKIQCYNPTEIPALANDNEFASDDFNKFTTTDPYISFDKPSCISFAEAIPDNSSSFFDLVQSNTATKNTSIMDIFNSSEQVKESTETYSDLQKYDSAWKMRETEWDDDDDALYQTSDTIEATIVKKQPSPPSSASGRALSPTSNILYDQDSETGQTSTPNKITKDEVQERRDNLLDILEDFQNNSGKEKSENFAQITENFNSSYILKDPISKHISNMFKQNTELKPDLILNQPESMPIEISNEIINMSVKNISENPDPDTEKINPSKRVQILESVIIKPGENNSKHDTQNELSKVNQTDNPNLPTHNIANTSNESSNNKDQTAESTQTMQSTLDLSNLLAGINTNTILLALQNLQQISQNTSTESRINIEQSNSETTGKESAEPVETINLTNDEDWEKESRCGSIERQLEQLDGNTGDTPFLSDIFDPGPIVIPPNFPNKLNINLKKRDDKEDSLSQTNENAPVIGNFKSFALPKPILLNRLKLTVKTPEKTKRSGAKRIKRKKKSKASASKDGAEGDDAEEEEEESGDEADLSKYDLWGSDEEGTSKADTDKIKDGENSKEDGADAADNGKAATETKSSKRRSSSTSSSSSSSSSGSSHSSTQAPKNKFDDFNLNSEREGSPRGRKSRSRSPRSRSSSRRKSRDSRSAGESRSSRDKERSRDRDRRERSRGSREGKERRYSRDGNHYSGRGRHR